MKKVIHSIKLILCLSLASAVLCGIHTAGVPKALRLFTIPQAVAESTEPDEEALQAQYDAAQALFDARNYAEAYEAFRALGSYADSHARAYESKTKWQAASYHEALELYESEAYYEARELFEALGSYKQSKHNAYLCSIKILALEYRQAKELLEAGEYEQARTMFEALGKYNDCPEQIKKIDEILQAQQQAELEQQYYEKAMELKENGDLKGARDALIEAGDCQDATEQLYIVLGLIAKEKVYQEAEADLAQGNPEDAMTRFLLLEEYRDSADKAAQAGEAWQAELYGQAEKAAAQDPERAYILFMALDGYQDSADRAAELQPEATQAKLYAAALALEQSGSYPLAKVGFEAASGYQDSRERARNLSQAIRQQQDYDRALYLSSIWQEAEAKTLLEALGDYNDAAALAAAESYRFTTKQLRDDRTSPVSEAFTAPDGTVHHYQIYKGVRTWVEAKAFCEILGGHLATLTTEEENTFVHSFMMDCGYRTAYFGLSDEERVGNWVWVTGEPFEYSNWDSGEPSRCAKERYGMYFYKHLKGTWNDSHFYEDAEVDPGCSYICEWDD